MWLDLLIITFKTIGGDYPSSFILKKERGENMKKIKKISIGPEVVLSMRRGRTFTDRKKQSSKWACRKKGKVKAQEIVS